MISENSSEKKRGRPRVLSLEMERIMRGYGAYQQGTRRGQLNEYYFMVGLKLFSDGDEFVKRWSWLHYNTYGTRGERWRRTIVSEIGRLNSIELMAEAADFVCERKPAARQAVSIIRRWRLTLLRQAEEHDLVRHLTGARQSGRNTLYRAPRWSVSSIRFDGRI